MTVGDAARRLGVTRQHVNVLASRGVLTRVARGLVDRTSVDLYVASHSGGRTRAWAEHTAWGAIGLLSGDGAEWLGQVQRSRLRAALRAASGPIDEGVDGALRDLVARMRDRATVNTYGGHRSAHARVRDHLVVTSRVRLGLADDESVVDGYLHVRALEDVVRRYHLRADPTGGITLRVTGFDMAIVERLATSDRVLAAVDAATSLDPRERGRGEQVLAEALARFV